MPNTDYPADDAEIDADRLRRHVPNGYYPALQMRGDGRLFKGVMRNRRWWEFWLPDQYPVWREIKRGE